MRPTPALAAGGRTVANLLSATEWMLPSPASQVHTIAVLPSHSPTPHHELTFSNLTTSLGNGGGGGKGGEAGGARFHVVRDDFLHPLANGNKARKLDALLPLLRRHGATDLVTCGGCQSSHAAAVVYAKRDEMLYEHATKVAGSNGTVMWADDIIAEDLVVDEDTTDGNCSRRVMIVKEGAESCKVFNDVPSTIFVTLHISSCRLQWRVTAIMLADTLERYRQQEKSLLSDFEKLYPGNFLGMVENDTHGSIVQWVERFSPRRFGKVLDGEISMCRQVAQQTGILLDPVYTLAAWEQAVDLCRRDSEAKVVMIHTGGTLGLFGLAQRYSPQFTTDEQS
nr:unnamed protein product [Digitaria exilis]